MKNVRNILFVVITCCMLLLSIVNIAADKLIPGYAADARSYLEGRAYQKFPETTIEAITAGQFQNQFEKYMSDSLPKKHRMMLVNAQAQRIVIGVARLPFDYDVIPTYYGSSYVQSVRWNSVAPIPPTRAGVYSRESLSASAQALNGLMKDYPSLRWRMALVDRPNITLASPVHDYMNEPVDYSYLDECYLSKLSEGCQCIDLSNTDTEEYYRKYFRTDHHWQIDGAVDAYNAIVNSFGFEPIAQMKLFTAYKGPFYGSEARSGLTLEQSDEVRDVEYDSSGKLSVVVNGTKKQPSFLGHALWVSKAPYKKGNQLANVYGDYFHNDYALIEISNSKAQTDDSLLIIGDSFTNNIERLFAEHFCMVYVMDPRNYEGTIRSFLNSHDIDSVVFLMSNSTLFTSKVQNKMK